MAIFNYRFQLFNRKKSKNSSWIEPTLTSMVRNAVYHIISSEYQVFVSQNEAISHKEICRFFQGLNECSDQNFMNFDFLFCHIVCHPDRENIWLRDRQTDRQTSWQADDLMSLLTRITFVNVYMWIIHMALASFGMNSSVSISWAWSLLCCNWSVNTLKMTA